MAYFAGYILREASLCLTQAKNRWGAWAAPCLPFVLLFSLVPVGWDTLQILHSFKDDTRIALMKMMGDKQKDALSELECSMVGRSIFTAFCPTFPYIPFTGNERYLVTNSFFDDMLFYGSTHALEKNARVELLWKKYEDLLQTPYCEIRPPYRSYAFNNPTLRVFSIMAINKGIKADPQTNGQPCSPEIIAGLPVKSGYVAQWPPLTTQEYSFFCASNAPEDAEEKTHHPMSLKQ
jgi:hypothetical protein